MSGPAPAKTKPKRPRTLLVTLALLAIAVGAAVPIAALDIGTRRSRACFAAVPAPRGADLPDCRKEVRWFVMPSRIPWTAWPARYRAEEIGARSAIVAYDDALVGHPDREAIKRAAAGIEASEKVLRDGSRRLALEELGPAIGAPNLGRQAEIDGDRATLLARFDRWTEWDIQLRALEAALVEGDLDRATVIARRYAEFDPHDEELRSAVAATLCLGDGAKRGIELFTTIENNRATQRHESWARDWGDVRAALVLCAARASVPPSPRPERADAGQNDGEEVRAALRLRMLWGSGRPAADDKASNEAMNAVIELLGSTRSPGARVRLLAALLTGKHGLRPAEIADIAAPKKGSEEPAILPSPASLTAISWLPTRRALAPVVTPITLRQAATTLRALAGSGEVTDEGATALKAAAGAAAIEAARSLAAAGDAAGAIAAIDDAGEVALSTAEARALARSSAYYLAGDPAKALEEIDRAAAPQGSLSVAIELQRAEILGSLGRREEAAKAAARAEAAATDAKDRSLLVRARWTRLAFDASAPAAAAPPPPGASWPWVGAVGTPASWLSAEAEGHEHLDRALAFFGRARAASPEDRRADRYAAFAHRGDLPSAPVAYLALAAELVGPGEGDVELWLDAFSAVDAHTLPLSTYAWIRAEAARARGDAASAETWMKRRRALAAILADPMRAEIAMTLGI